MSRLQAGYALDMDVDNVCRICLSQTDASERLFHIFSSAIVDGFLVAIPEVLEFCVNLTVTESDRMPCKICQKCKGQLLGFYLFKQKCQRTDKVLQEAFGSMQKQKSSNRTFENEKSDDDNAIDLEILETQTNGDEDEVEVEPVSEFMDVPMSDPPEFQCHLCDQIFRTEEDLKEHTVDHCTLISDQDQYTSMGEEQLQGYTSEVDHESVEVKMDYKIPSESNVLEAADEDRVCYLEDAKMVEEMPIERFPSDQSDSISHIREEDDESLTNNVKANEETDETKSINGVKIVNTNVASLEQLCCNICGKIVKGQSRYYKHLQTHDIHTNVTEFLTYHICSICLKVYLDENELSIHTNAESHDSKTIPTDSDTPYTCGICSAEYTRIDHAKQHMLSHLTSFACPFPGCGCEYSSAARLGLHISGKHIEYETHQCRYCGANSFESMAELQQHLRVKCNGKKFPCHHCDKKFLSSRSLAHHLKCLEKKHRCAECGKTFAQHGELKLHERMHNGERPFKCTVCGKSYKTASLRTAHMDSHIEGKTFQCQLCGKQLQTRTCYRNHIKRHSEERKYECDVCSKKFYTKYNVKIHKQKVHKLIDGSTSVVLETCDE
ncbi:zinc finger imprinted 3-like [Armigeres subalbatus]|uniref:zinc finger imprinted 3-like n=1 Tax=Armigeres subalbatus TaxID=124917 RepID=UPI002ED1EEF9